MILTQRQHFSQKSIKKKKKKYEERNKKKAATPKGNENSQESQNYFTPETFFLSGESRRPNRLFRLASTSSSLTPSSLPFAP